MISPGDLLKGIQTVQTLLNQIEVRGIANAKALSISYEYLNSISEELRKTLEEIQNGTDKESDIDGENDTSSA